MRIKLFYLLSPQSTINNISGVMLNNSDPNSIPQRPAQWVDKSNYLCGYFKLSLIYSLICTCRGQNIGEYFHFFSFDSSSGSGVLTCLLLNAHNLYLLGSGLSHDSKLSYLTLSFSRSPK